jgi:hypothetical protein
MLRVNILSTGFSGGGVRVAEAMWHRLPIGDWATIAGSVFVGASLIILAIGTWTQARETRRQVRLDRSSQARLVGAFIDFRPILAGTRAGTQIVSMTVVNSSTLPIRRVHGYLFASEDRRNLASFFGRSGRAAQLEPEIDDSRT